MRRASPSLAPSSTAFRYLFHEQRNAVGPFGDVLPNIWCERVIAHDALDQGVDLAPLDPRLRCSNPQHSLSIEAGPVDPRMDVNCVINVAGQSATPRIGWEGLLR